MPQRPNLTAQSTQFHPFAVPPARRHLPHANRQTAYKNPCNSHRKATCLPPMPFLRYARAEQGWHHHQDSKRQRWLLPLCQALWPDQGLPRHIGWQRQLPHDPALQEARQGPDSMVRRQALQGGDLSGKSCHQIRQYAPSSASQHRWCSAGLMPRQRRLTGAGAGY